MRTAVLAPGALALVTLCACAPTTRAQLPVGRDAALSLHLDPVSFDPPEPELHEVAGVRVLFLEDHALPLVDVFARFRGGYAFFGRDDYATGTALPGLLRYGGTDALPPDSVEVMLERYAIAPTFGGDGESITSSMNVLSEHLAVALELWGGMLRDARFDTAQVEIWRGRELESVRRSADSPTRLAFTEFNRLLYGDHPIGWQMDEGDLAPGRLSSATLRALHRRIVCPGNAVLGVTGDVTWTRVEPLLDRLLSGWPACPDTLPRPPIPDIRREPGVFVIQKDLDQSVVVMAHPTAVHLADDPSYFSATIGNAILGGGGFSSRLMARVRTERGYAYSASSLWTTPRRYDGLVGAVTQTRPDRVIPSVRLILETMDGLRAEPPTDEDVGTAVDRIANGFVFNFETAAQIVSRQMLYLSLDMPSDWLRGYLRGVQAVTPESVHRVFADNLRPREMTILVVGDTTRMGDLRELGPVTVIDPPR